MARRTRWMLLGACLALPCMGWGCGGDDSGGKTKPGDAGLDGDRDGGPGDGDGDGDGDDLAPVLDDGVAGSACSSAEACPPAGSCADALSGGAVGSLLGVGAGAVEAGYCTGACQKDAQCGADGVCFGEGSPELAVILSMFGDTLPASDGECRKPCETSADCRDGLECAKDNDQLGPLGSFLMFESTCQAKPVLDQLAADQAGTPCSSDADCGDGLCNRERDSDPDAGAAGMPTIGAALDFPGGYCSGSCASDADCGANGSCLPGLYGSGGRCYEGCSVDTDCARDADGYDCGDLAGKKVCLPAPNALPDGIVGSACASAEACGPGACADVVPGAIMGLATPPDLPAPGGYCTGPCTGNDDCGAGGACTLTRLNPPTSQCVLSCTTPADCPRDGYTCGVSGLGTQACVPGEEPALDGGVSDAG